MKILVDVVFTIASALALWHGSRRRRRKAARRPIERRATTTIAGLREGEQTKIRGVVAAREALLTSPIGGRTCIGYRAIIDDVTHDPAFVWTPLVSREAWPSFLVEDETGTVAVQGAVEILVDPSDSGENLPSRVYDLLAEDKVRMKDLWRARRFWFRETLLKVGDRVSVVGRPTLEIDPAGQGSFREPPRLYVMRGTRDEPVVVIDDDEPAPL